ncbi:MAG: hypothetical protein ACLGSH_18155 [Acidobacteriota bacterium]
MPTTIDATTTFTEVPPFSNRVIRSCWKAHRNITNAASYAFTAAKRGTTEHIIPTITKGADVTLRAVDGACTKANKATVAFLVKYPGIAMTLSPQTIVRMAVAEHYKEMASQPAAGNHIGDAIDNVEHAVVNIMQ